MLEKIFLVGKMVSKMWYWRKFFDSEKQNKKFGVRKIFLSRKTCKYKESDVGKNFLSLKNNIGGNFPN